MKIKKENVHWIMVPNSKWKLELSKMNNNNLFTSVGIS